jgi:hypothetical protein
MASEEEAAAAAKLERFLQWLQALQYSSNPLSYFFVSGLYI